MGLLLFCVVAGLLLGAGWVHVYERRPAVQDAQDSDHVQMATAFAPTLTTESEAQQVDLPLPASLLPNPSPTDFSGTSLIIGASIAPSPEQASTPMPTAAPTATPLPPLCPLPTPERLRAAQGLGRPWPQPEPSLAVDHLWLSNPIAATDRPIINWTFPYGSDGQGVYLLHNGVDMWGAMGQELVAAATGTVVVAGADSERLWGFRCDWYGQLVVIELDRQWRDQPVYILYGHIVDLAVEPGQRIYRGDPVASVGVGGVAVEPHLHFEVRVGEDSFWSTRNPELWLWPGDGRGTLAGRVVDDQGHAWAGVPVEVLGLTAGTHYRETWTYLDHDLVQPDKELGENFVVSQLPAGRYRVGVEVNGRHASQEVTVEAGKVSFALLQR